MLSKHEVRYLYRLASNGISNDQYKSIKKGKGYLTAVQLEETQTSFSLKAAPVSIQLPRTFTLRLMTYSPPGIDELVRSKSISHLGIVYS